VTLEVVEPGLLTTVQDAGRFGWTHLGVPVGGACDPWSYAVANLLAGADAGAAALEMTIAGPTLKVRAATIVGLAGADLGGVVRETGRRLLPGRSYGLAAGSTVAFPGGDPGAGARAYLALPGGIDVPAVLGSRATLLSAGFGGIDGRPIRAGDLVASAAVVDPALRPGERAWPWLDGDPFASAGEPVRVVPGPGPGVEEIVARAWRVAPDSDRIGLRLEAAGDVANATAGGAGSAAGSGELLSHGVVHGAIQLPPGGTPLVLLADHQTTGGYLVAAVIARADHPRLGQLRPGEVVRFVAVGPDDARAAYAEQARALTRGAAALRGDDAWDELWRSAGR
jgi:antagonist of KipI